MLRPEAIRSCGATVRATSDAAGWEPYNVSDGVLLLKRDLLDQQIIDVHGRKVVRVNDVELDSNAGQQPRARSTCSPSTSAPAARSGGSPKAWCPRSRCARCSKRFRRA